MGKGMKKLVAGLGFAMILLAPGNGSADVGGGIIVFRPAGAAIVIYSHEDHFKAGLKCKDCHYRIYPKLRENEKTTMADMGRGRSCGACHNGGKAFGLAGNTCTKCHR